ncbi:MAG: hypothetical protein H6833_07365 [Planctomycetes bacterium]|nr:hypothetical protein [Planctomycetota bacterium]
MTNPKRSFRAMERLCDSPTDDDGLPPDRWKKTSDKQPTHRKTLMLLKQIRQCVEYVLEYECRDDFLSTLELIDIRAGASSNHVTITLGTPRPHDPEQVRHLEESLEQWKPRLRQEVARVITRKRVPELNLHLAYLTNEEERT